MRPAEDAEQEVYKTHSPGPDRESRFSGLVLTIAETCAATKMSRSSIYKLIASGSLPAKKCGARTIILGDDLDRFLRNLPSYPTAHTPKKVVDDVEKTASSSSTSITRATDEPSGLTGPTEGADGPFR